MELKEYKNDSYFFSGKASEIARGLGYAGIAIIWIFKQTDSSLKILPTELICPLLFFILFFLFDLLQYLLSYCIWYFFYRYHEKKGLKPTDDIKADSSLYMFGQALFILKMISLFIAFYKLFSYFLKLL